MEVLQHSESTVEFEMIEQRIKEEVQAKPVEKVQTKPSPVSEPNKPDPSSRLNPGLEKSSLSTEPEDKPITFAIDGAAKEPETTRAVTALETTEDITDEIKPPTKGKEIRCTSYSNSTNVTCKCHLSIHYSFLSIIYTI